MPQVNSISLLHHPGTRYAMILVLGVAIGAVAYRQLAERPLWAYFTLLIIGLAPLALFFTNRRGVHLFGLLVIGLLIAGVYLADKLQETETELVLRITEELLRATEQADYTVFDRYLAPDYRWQSMNRQAMMNRIRSSLLPSTSRSCSISSSRAKSDDGGRTYLVEGNLSASGTFGSQEGFFSGTIELKYARQPDGSMKVTGTKVAWYNGNEVTIPR
jgi:hypothetical protein